nr:hypothetical protein [Tanacetum cinerariifolium]
RNINLIATQQVALDNALVAPEKRLKIKKCNARIEFSNPRREEIYQVTLDALKLSPCYLEFLFTAEVPKVYMHQFWNTIKKIKDTYAYRFKLDKKKLRIDTESTTVPTAAVVRDTPCESMSKKKTPTKGDKGKGMDLLSEASLLDATQLKKTLKKSKLETHKLHASGSGDGVGSQPKFLMSLKTRQLRNSKDGDSHDDDSDDASNDDDDDGSDAGGDNEASESEKTDSDKDENPNLNQNEDEEEEYEEEYVRTPDNYEFTDDDEEYKELYKDVKVSLKDAEHEEEGKGDAEMTNAGCNDGTQ